MIEIKERQLTVREFIFLFYSVGWKPPDEEQTAKALANTLCTFSIYDSGKLVGMGRIGRLCDVMLLKRYRDTSRISEQRIRQETDALYDVLRKKTTTSGLESKP
jgi:hypothetical protein